MNFFGYVLPSSFVFGEGRICFEHCRCFGPSAQFAFELLGTVS